MISNFEESRLNFTFNDDYELIKADKNVNIENVKQFLPNTKDMDLLGFYEKDKIFFMEIKNFRGAPLEKIDTLTNEVAQKLRDTIAIIAGASRKSTNDIEFWRKMHEYIGRSEKEIFVVFWLEQDLQNQRDKHRLKNITDSLKKKCKWLTTKIMVQNIENNGLKGVSVSFLPQNN